MAHDRPASGSPLDLAVAELAAVTFRDDLTVREIPAPAGLAPASYALAGDVRPEPGMHESLYGTGRFLLLHDASEPEPWGGPWRIVCFAQAPLDADIGADPLVADVAWSWLVDALASRGARYQAASGTATKTLSKGFGSLAAEGDGAQIELRASWSPTGGLGDHVEAWAELVCMLAGLPPGSEGIEQIRGRGTARA